MCCDEFGNTSAHGPIIRGFEKDGMFKPLKNCGDCQGFKLLKTPFIVESVTIVERVSPGYMEYSVNGVKHTYMIAQETGLNGCEVEELKIDGQLITDKIKVAHARNFYRRLRK